MAEECKHYCGECCWFCFELTDGDGQCVEVGDDGYPMMMKRCDSKACDKFVSSEQMRHYIAVLLQHNRWRRSNEVPDHCRMVDPTELGKAIDFAVKYMKIFKKL